METSEKEQHNLPTPASEPGEGFIFGTLLILLVILIMYFFARTHNTTDSSSPTVPNNPATAPAGGAGNFQTPTY